MLTALLAQASKNRMQLILAFKVSQQRSFKFTSLKLLFGIFLTVILVKDI